MCLLYGSSKAEAPIMSPGLRAMTCVPLLDGGDVLRLHALLALGSLVGDLLAFFEGPEPAACYPAEVHEEVFATLIGGDEAVALLVVEPLDRSLGHIPKPAFLSLG
jgi:hypothetical protein